MCRIYGCFDYSEKYTPKSIDLKNLVLFSFLIRSYGVVQALSDEWNDNNTPCRRGPTTKAQKINICPFRLAKRTTIFFDKKLNSREVENFIYKLQLNNTGLTNIICPELSKNFKLKIALSSFQWFLKNLNLY